MFRRGVVCAVGVLLVIAACFKLYGLNYSPTPQTGYFLTPWVQVVTVEWEIGLGIWLLSGKGRIGAWFASIVTFLTFAIVSGYSGWHGQSSCNCFGAVKVTPWHALTVDLAILLALAVIRPSFAPLAQIPEEDIRSALQGSISCLLLLGGTIAVTIGTMTLAYGDMEAALASLRGEGISVIPPVVDLGVGKPREYRNQPILLVNRTDRRVRVVGATVGCACQINQDLPIYLSPFESKILIITFQLPRDPSTMVDERILLVTDDNMTPLVGVRFLAALELP